MHRRFIWIAAALAVGFAATQTAAVLHLIPHLAPVTFQQLITNPLFAIGFAGPLLLHLSSLPRWREIVATLLLAAILTGLSILVAEEKSVMQAVIGLGLASTIVLAARRNLDFFLPSLVTLFFTLDAAMFLNVISHYAPVTLDGYAYAGDTKFGAPVAFLVGQLFAASPLLAIVCTGIYLAPPPGLMFVYALEAKAKERPRADIVTLLVALGVVGYSLYFLFPVCGPKFAYGAAFPHHPPLPHPAPLAVPVAPRNGMPSLHMASALIALLHARRFGRIATAVGWVFAIGTFLATMGTGEHYLVDLIAAIPFTFGFHMAFERRFGWAALHAIIFFGFLTALRWAM